MRKTGVHSVFMAEITLFMSLSCKIKMRLIKRRADMSPAWRTLDLAILHKLILEELLGIDQNILAKGENLQYVKDTPNAIDDTI